MTDRIGTALGSVLSALADLSAEEAADGARADQHRRWAAGERVPVEAYLAALPAVAADPEQAMVLVYGEVLARAARGESPTPAEYRTRFPQWAERLEIQFQLHAALGRTSVSPDPGIGDNDTRPADDTRPPDATGPYVPADGHAVPASEANRYRLGAELARGGMGVVYRARDTVLQREVAVKVLADQLRGTDAARRFAVEAAITAGLQHPSIPPVHDLGTLPDGRPFLAMKLIRGETLAKRLAALKQPTTRGSANEDDGDPERQALFATFERICLAVAFAHSRRVIHRDLKPANVMVGAFGEVQVMDWGLAKRLGHPDELGDAAPSAGDGADEWVGADERTRAGQVMGTPSYMPPEQARAELDRVDERADVFALGGILCAILTGRPPYTGRCGREVWRKASAAELGDALAALAAVHGMPRYKRIAVRCLDPDPAKRYSHAGEVAAAVDDARTTAERARRRDEVSEATDIADRAESRERWRRLWWQVVGLLGLPCGIFGLVAIWHSGGFSDGLGTDSGRVKVIPIVVEREPKPGGVKATPSAPVVVVREPKPIDVDGYFWAIFLLTAREMEDETFRKDSDDRRRTEAEKPARLLVESRNRWHQVLGYVLLAALADATDNPQRADASWSSAIDAAPTSWVTSKAVPVCLYVIREFDKHPPSTLSRQVMRRVTAVLVRESQGDHSEKHGQEIADALVKSVKLLNSK